MATQTRMLQLAKPATRTGDVWGGQLHANADIIDYAITGVNELSFDETLIDVTINGASTDAKEVAITDTTPDQPSVGLSAGQPQRGLAPLILLSGGSLTSNRDRHNLLFRVAPGDAAENSTNTQHYQFRVINNSTYTVSVGRVSVAGSALVGTLIPGDSGIPPGAFVHLRVPRDDASPPIIDDNESRALRTAKDDVNSSIASLLAAAGVSSTQISNLASRRTIWTMPTQLAGENADSFAASGAQIRIGDLIVWHSHEIPNGNTSPPLSSPISLEGIADLGDYPAAELTPIVLVATSDGTAITQDNGGQPLPLLDNGTYALANLFGEGDAPQPIDHQLRALDTLPLTQSGNKLSEARPPGIYRVYSGWSGRVPGRGRWLGIARDQTTATPNAVLIDAGTTQTLIANDVIAIRRRADNTTSWTSDTAGWSASPLKAWSNTDIGRPLTVRNNNGVLELESTEWSGSSTALIAHNDGSDNITTFEITPAQYGESSGYDSIEIWAGWRSPYHGSPGSGYAFHRVHYSKIPLAIVRQALTNADDIRLELLSGTLYITFQADQNTGGSPPTGGWTGNINAGVNPASAQGETARIFEARLLR